MSMSPQASDELARKWLGPHDKVAMDYLDACGFVLTSDWEWARETPPNKEEASAIQFMVEEWDYGGYVKWQQD